MEQFFTHGCNRGFLIWSCHWKVFLIKNIKKKYFKVKRKIDFIEFGELEFICEFRKNNCEGEKGTGKGKGIGRGKGKGIGQG